MATKHTGEIAITERMYIAYGSETGILFGIPANLRGSVETIVKIAIEDSAAPTLQARIDELEAELLTLITFSADLQQRLEAEKAELLAACRLAVEALQDHVQYDNPDDEPSLEAIALQATQAVIAKAEPVEPTKTESEVE